VGSFEVAWVLRPTEYTIRCISIISIKSYNMLIDVSPRIGVQVGL